MSKKVSKFLAKLVTEDRKPCAFCRREIDDEITYGKLYSIGSIQCHYFCVLLSCCLVQKGKDEEGLFGFMYPDILAELERSKKHRCSYCGRGGATLGCTLSQCRKQFHLPCGRERHAVSLFYGNFKSFCEKHAPKQKIAEDVMAKARLRMAADRKNSRAVVPKTAENDVAAEALSEDSLCVICYEEVTCYPTPATFWPPCCARDKWFHRTCLQRMALSAGMHYLKCPLCNDKNTFYKAVLNQGYYVPDRDAAWELEQNAFAEIYERDLSCNMPECLCPLGRDHDADNGPWDIRPCLLCGTASAHARCVGSTRHVCGVCRVCAPQDLATLAATVEQVVLASEASRPRTGPIMPSRMSLRRTKQRQVYYRNSDSSSQSSLESHRPPEAVTDNLPSSRQDLNLKTPRRFQKDPETTMFEKNPETSILRDILENTLLSPMKLIEQGFREKVKKIVGEMDDVVIEPSVLEKVRHKFRKPKPWSEKKKIVDNILEDLVNDVIKHKKPKTKDPVREWCSPKKGTTNNDENQAPQTETTEDTTQATNPEVPKSPRISRASTPQKTPSKSPSKTENNTPMKNNDNTDIKSHCTPLKEVETVVIKGEDTSSTIKLPPEFIGEDNNSIAIFDTPKKLKTVEIQKDSSMEISEHNDVVNINVVEIKNDSKLVLVYPNMKSPVKTEKCTFKFSPKDKESLEKKKKIDIDLESFKNQYLIEVDRDFKCQYSHSHKHTNDKASYKLQTAIDFAIEASSKERKRKIKSKKKSGKRRRLEDTAEKTDTKVKFKIKLSKKSKNHRKYVPYDSRLKTSPKMEQYVLKYTSPSEVIGKPDKKVTPIKKKHIKSARSLDNLIQTSINSFFKTKSPED